MDGEIRREERPDGSLVPDLDPTLFEPTGEEWAFLRSAIVDDEEQMKNAVMDLQKEAYAHFPYPCIYLFHFTCLFMAQNAIYPEVIDAGRTGTTTFLDIGCMMGTDVRKLAMDGYPAERILACDIRPEFFALGHRLFRDGDSCPIHFFASDLLELSLNASPAQGGQVSIREITDLSQLRGRVDHVYTGALFHLFDEPTQYAMALRIATLLKRHPGAVVFGRHQGLEKEGVIADHMSRFRYGHSPRSWREMWKAAFEEVEGVQFAERVVVDAELRRTTRGEIATCMLYWSVKIV